MPVCSSFAGKEQQKLILSNNCNKIYSIEKQSKSIIILRNAVNPFLFFYKQIAIITSLLSVLYQYYFKQLNFILSMQSGTQLHIALLRKISQLMPTSNFRERFNQSKRKRQYFRGNLTEQSNDQEKNQPSWPLFELISNKTPSNHSKTRNKTSKRLLREENITISAWSIDEKDAGLPLGEQEESRYEKKQRENTKMDLSEPKKRRNFSFNTNPHIKRPLPEIEFFRSPSQDQNSRSKQEKEGFSRSRFSKIRHININLDKENQLSILEHCLVKSTKVGSADKISSYNAFVNEMKMQERNRKLRN